MKRILLICAFLLALAVQAGAQSKQQQQQPVEVNGLVVDSDDVPIVGATVYIKDEPGIGSITNSEGRFKLTAKLYNTLAVSFMGYETAEQIITSAADVKITLREGNQMEEVVVIGMGTQRKVSVTAPWRWSTPKTSTARDEYRQHARRPRPGRDFHPVER